MAVKTIYLHAATSTGSPNFFGLASETAPGATANNTGWTVAKGAINLFWKARLGAGAAVASGAGQASSQIDSTSGPTKGTAATTAAAGDSFVIGPLSGTFANTAWTFNFRMLATVVSSQQGRMRCRVWKSTNADGTSATALTGTTLVGSTITVTGTVANSTVTWSPGALTLTNEYLFFQVEWQAIVAGGSTTANVLFNQTTTIANDSTVVTPDWAPSVNAVVLQTLDALSQSAIADVATVIWDNSAAHQYDPTYFTLTNSNLTVEKATDTGNPRSIVASKYRIQGSTAYYYEATINAGTPTGRYVGLTDFDFVNNLIQMNNYPGRGGMSGGGFSVYDSGEYYGMEGDLTFGSRGTGWATFDDADVIGVLFKTRTGGVPMAWSTYSSPANIYTSSTVNATFFLQSAYGASIFINGSGTLNASAYVNTPIVTNGYFEFKVHDITNSPGQNMIGLCNTSQSLSSNLNTANAIAYGSGGNKYGTETGTGGATWVDGDIIGCMYTGTQVKFYRNGTLQYTCSTLPSGSLYPAIATGNVWFGVHSNFGSLAFANTPSGAVAAGDIHGDAEVYKNGTLVATFKAPYISFPCVALRDVTAPADKITANFGATAFANQPLGSTSWDGSRVVGTGPTITVAQTLGALTQALAGTHPVSATVAQTLGGLVQVATDTVLARAAVTQTLGALSQAATAAAIDSATTAQTLGALAQVAAATAPDAITVAQNLGALTQSAAATHPDTAAAAQTLGAIVQTATGGVIAAATAAQTLGALAQAATATASTAANAVVNQTLGSLGQAATAAALDQATVSQTLGALAQVAAATAPDAATVAQNLGALTQAAAASHPDTAAVAQTLGAIVQTATAGAVDTATASQTLGALAQAAAATNPVAATASQTLGALAQAASATHPDTATIAQTLGALSQTTAGAVVTSATVAQALGALVQAATAVHAGTVNIDATQTLGALAQALTGTAVDTATVSQSLGALGQAVAATHPDTASVAQTLGSIVQTLTGQVIDNAAVSQALGALNQTATAATTTGFLAAQTLGGLVQALTGTVVSHATIAQALGGLGQTTTGGPVARIGAYTDALPALGQAATTVHVSFANVAQVLGALSQIATATGPGPANFQASQILGALGQVATSAVADRALAAQVLGALIQSAAARSTPPTHIHLQGRLNAAQIAGQIGVSVGHLNGRLGQRAAIQGQLE